MSLWKKIRHRLEAAVLRFFAWLVPRLSRDGCVRLANGLGEFAYRLDHRGRHVALENLRCAFGDRLTPEGRKAVARESYRNFARTIVDLFWAPALARPENRHWLRVENWEKVADNFGPGKRGAMFVTLHFGNWEWANLAGGFLGQSYPVVAEKFKNPMLESIFTGLRQASGATIIPQESSMIRMLKTVKRGGITAMLADLCVPPSQAATVIRAFGMELSVSVLHAVLAQRGGARVYPVLARPDPDGGSTVIVSPELEITPEASWHEIAQRCWDFYEPLVRAHPGMWLWPYKHFRYKPRDTDTEYPFYANKSGAFEKLRRRELEGA
jgi:Kdo2-lipid IVA lauroyltransferase/acyltransferase